MKKYPLTDIQAGMLFESLRRDYVSPVYISQMVFSIDDAIDPPLFVQAFAVVLQRHPMLQSGIRFDVKRQSFVQFIDHPMEMPQVFFNYTEMDEATQLKNFNDFLSDDLNNPFILENPPLMRLAFFKLDNKKYRIVWTRHHILMGGASVALVVKEVFTLYTALLKQEPCILLPPTSYHKIETYRDQLDKETTEQFWKEYLSNFSNAIFLPELGNNEKKIKKIESEYTQLNGKAYTRLVTYVAENQLTVNTLLEGAWGIVLSNYTGGKEVIFGSVRAYPREVVENCVGLFINTLPVRLALDSSGKVIDYLKSILEKNKQLKKFIPTPLSDIKKWLGLSSEASLFKSVIDYKPYSLNTLMEDFFENLHCSVHLYGDIPYPLTLEIIKEKKSLNIVLHYDVSLFDKQYIHSFLFYFKKILQELTHHPEKRMVELPTLTKQDWESICAWNETAVFYSKHITIHQLFEEQVKKTPFATAVVYEDERLSYEQLNKRANQLAHYLIQSGIQIESTVAVLLKPSLYTIVAVLAVLKAGGSYVSIDSMYPKNRIHYLLEDSQSKIIITESKQIDFLSPTARKRKNNTLLIIDLDHFIFSTYPETNPCLPIQFTQLMYIIYTSGSTGKPKGVMVEHRSAVNMALSCISLFKMHDKSRILQISSFSFDVFVAEWCMTLLSGACLYLMDKVIFSPDAIVAALKKYKITTIFLPTSILAALPKLTLPYLKVIACGGEICDASVGHFWSENRLFLNLYGITEAAVCSTASQYIADQKNTSIIGKPLPNTQVYVLSESQTLLPLGVPGELYIGGEGVARGYVNNPEMTADKFITLSVGENKKCRFYKTGDKGRWLLSGELEFLGRLDEQVKIRGFRIELREVERALEKHPEINKAIVLPSGSGIDKRLHAYIVYKKQAMYGDEIKQFVQLELPRYMVPSHFFKVEQFALTPNGKIDKEKLLALQNPVLIDNDVEQRAELSILEKKIVSVIQSILNILPVPIDKNFFDLGFDSLSLVYFSVRLSEVVPIKIEVSELFLYTTIKQLLEYIESKSDDHKNDPARNTSKARKNTEDAAENSFAIIGMAGRFPGAKNLKEFWDNILVGKETISHFSEEQLREVGIDASLLHNPSYVKAAGILDDIDQFDAHFFGMTPYEASIADPQHRLFLEVCWEALEIAGYSQRGKEVAIGVFAGASDSTYLQNCLLKNEEFLQSHYPYQTQIATSGNFLATKVSYHLDLTGPSININTACSTSLVTVIMACQSLLNHECDMALAGGAFLRVPQMQGYLYQEGGILSKDGRCRAFDKEATGTVSSSGMGVVVLKRLSDAIRDEDTIDAVIKGYGLNNDGAKKMAYTAPSISAQSRCIASALASVETESIAYVEAHGTGTALGDSIEIAALTKAFRQYTSKTQYCAIGSVKTNIGHANTAAGIAGLIKTVMALKHAMIPATLHFKEANPQIDFLHSPFYVNNIPLPWKKGIFPRRAGVSAFGIGGTNAHVIVEEAPFCPISSKTKKYPLFRLPTYPFEKKRHWVDPDPLPNKNAIMMKPETDLSRCFYQISWHRLELLTGLLGVDFSKAKDKCWFIFIDRNNLSDQLLQRLRFLGARVIFIYKGSDFEKITEEEYIVNPEETEKFKKYLKLIFKKINTPFQIIHLWRLEEEPSDRDEHRISEKLHEGLYTLMLVVQTFSALHPDKKMTILLVNNYLESVFSNDLVSPVKATLLGACQVIPLEFSNIQIATLDIESHTHDSSESVLADCLIAETCKISEYKALKHLAYRGGYRWEKTFQPLELTQKTLFKTPIVFRNHGVYLITGGLGGIGLAVAQYIARVSQARLVLISRAKIPSAEEWEQWLLQHTSEHPHYTVIKTLSFLKAQNISIFVYSADIASYDEMSNALALIEDEVGSISGVIHAAGVAGSGLIPKKTKEDIERILRPKLMGTYVLSRLFKSKPLEFIVLFSSLTSLTGGIGQYEYAAANAALDAFPYTNCFDSKTLVTTINWNAWLESGMFAEILKANPCSENDLNELNRKNGLTSEQGNCCLALSLNKKLKNLIISRFSISDVMAYKRKQSLLTLSKKEYKNKGITENYDTLENKIIAIFQATLGIKTVHSNDDFFDLGGDSLNALSLIQTIEKQCGIRLSLNQIYEMTTPLQLINFIKKSTGKKSESSLVVLNPKGNKPPLFLVHPVGGTVFCYIPLSHRLKDQTLYAIQDPGLMQLGYTFGTLEAMAHYYVSEIQRVQPQGPYYLGGYSMGGTLAFEMAHQLLQRGEKLAFLGLFDSWAIFTDEFRDKAFFEKKMYNHLEDMERGLKPFLGDYVDQWLSSQWQRMQLLLHYKPNILHAKISLFKAKTLLPEYSLIDDPCNHWQPYSSYPLDIFSIPGDHDTLLSAANVGTLAHQLLIGMIKIHE